MTERNIHACVIMVMFLQNMQRCKNIPAKLLLYQMQNV